MILQTPLELAFTVADQSKQIDKLLVVGTRIDGSLVLLHTGMTSEEIQQLCMDCRAWVGDKLAMELQAKALQE